MCVCPIYVRLDANHIVFLLIFNFCGYLCLEYSETHNNVTVFFSDIVRFTDISRNLSALKVSHMLDRLYLAFDELATKHEVFKVETIGDAWMGVTNCKLFFSCLVFVRSSVGCLSYTDFLLIDF